MQPRTRTVGGVTYTEVGPGQWQAQAAPTPEASPVIYGTRPQPMATPQAPAVETNTRTQTRRTEAEIPTVGVPTGVERPTPGGTARGIPGSPYGAADSGLMWNQDGTALVPIPGFQRPAPAPDPKQTQDRAQQQAAVEMLTRNFITNRGLFRENIEGGAWATTGRYLSPNFWSGDYGDFDRSGEGLANDAMRVLRVPGQGDPARQQEERTNRINAPNSWESDKTNLGIYRDLQVRIEEAREAAGLPPIDWEASIERGEMIPLQTGREAQNSAAGTNLSTAIYRPNAPDRGTPDNQASVRDIEDPVRRGHAMEIQGMVNNLEIGDAEILAYHARHFPGEEPVGLRDFLEQRRDPNSDVNRAIRQGRTIPVDPGWYRNQRDATAIEQISGAALDNPIGTGGATYLNSLLGGWAPDLAGFVGGDTEAIRAGLEGARAENPFSALAGDITGAVGAMGTAGRAANALNIMQNAPRSRALLGDLAYGASYGAGSNPDDRAGGAMTGAALQGGGGVLGREGVRALASTARGVSNPAVQRLRESGIPMTTGATVGQSGMLGQIVQGAENAATSIPVLGRMVARRQAESRNAFNQSTWDEALAPINQRIGNRVGEEASDEAARLYGQAYGSVFNGRTFTLDPVMDTALTTRSAAAANLPTHNEPVQRMIDNEIRPLLAAGDVQAAHRLIRERRADYAAMADGRAASREIGKLQDDLEAMIARSHPGAMTDLTNANRAFRLSNIAQRATGAAVNNADTPGAFTPAQLGQQARNNARTYGGNAEASSTRRPFYQSQRDAQSVLPNSLPNSGTTDRLLVGGTLLGGTGGVDYLSGEQGAATGPAAGILAALTALYTRGGQRLVNGMLASRPQGVRDVANRASRQYFQLPGKLGERLAPVLPPVTLPQITGTTLGTTLASLLGQQAEDRVY